MAKFNSTNVYGVIISKFDIPATLDITYISKRHKTISQDLI